MYFVQVCINDYFINPHIGGYKRETDAINCIKRYGTGLVQHFKNNRLYTIHAYYQGQKLTKQPKL